MAVISETEGAFEFGPNVAISGNVQVNHGSNEGDRSEERCGILYLQAAEAAL